MTEESLWLYGKDGAKYRAYIYQDRINTSGLHGPGSIPGSKTARLEDGTPLNYIDENTFKNPLTGELLSRSSASWTVGGENQGVKKE